MQDQESNASACSGYLRTNVMDKFSGLTCVEEKFSMTFHSLNQTWNWSFSNRSSTICLIPFVFLELRVLKYLLSRTNLLSFVHGFTETLEEFPSDHKLHYDTYQPWNSDRGNKFPRQPRTKPFYKIAERQQRTKRDDSIQDKPYKKSLRTNTLIPPSVTSILNDKNLSSNTCHSVFKVYLSHLDQFQYSIKYVSTPTEKEIGWRSNSQHCLCGRITSC